MEIKGTVFVWKDNIKEKCGMALNQNMKQVGEMNGKIK